MKVTSKDNISALITENKIQYHTVLSETSN